VSEANGMKLNYFSRSEKGLRETNEDAYYAGRIGRFWLFAVADGLGGHQAGEQASALALEVLTREVESGTEDPKDMLERIAHLIHLTTQERAFRDRELYGMATTLIAVLVDESGSCTFMNVGDSRAYIIQDGIVRHTRDQNVVQDLLAAGKITEEEALNHPLRNIINQALGDPDSAIEPDFYAHTFRDGWMVLSSDGLHDFVRKERILEIVTAGRLPEEICGRLVEEAVRNGSDDNITVVVVWSRNIPGVLS